MATKSSKPTAQCCAIPPTGVRCSACNTGTLEPARGRFGPVYKCTNKPACKFFLTARPTGDFCNYPREEGAACGGLMVEGTKTIPDRCSDKSCPNRNPHRLPSEGERRGAIQRG